VELTIEIGIRTRSVDTSACRSLAVDRGRRDELHVLLDTEARTVTAAERKTSVCSPERALRRTAERHGELRQAKQAVTWATVSRMVVASWLFIALLAAAVVVLVGASGAYVSERAGSPPAGRGAPVRRPSCGCYGTRATSSPRVSSATLRSCRRSKSTTGLNGPRTRP
jgi:hypothetical protein